MFCVGNSELCVDTYSYWKFLVMKNLSTQTIAINQCSYELRTLHRKEEALNTAVASQRVLL